MHLNERITQCPFDVLQFFLPECPTIRRNPNLFKSSSIRKIICIRALHSRGVVFIFLTLVIFLILLNDPFTDNKWGSSWSFPRFYIFLQLFSFLESNNKILAQNLWVLFNDEGRNNMAVHTVAIAYEMKLELGEVGSRNGLFEEILHAQSWILVYLPLIIIEGVIASLRSAIIR